MSLVATVISVVLAGVLIFGLTVMFARNSSEALQQGICQSNIALGNQIIDEESNSWVISAVKSEIGENAVAHPLCVTQVKTIDVSSSKDFLKDATIEIGEMVESCWKSFGQGEIINTFGQGTKDFGFVNNDNYYFTCHRFKIRTPDSQSLDPMDLIGQEDSIGSLWKYNIQGRELNIHSGNLLQESVEADVPSYAGFVFKNGFGYLEFMETVKDKLSFGFADLRDGGTGIGFYSKSLPQSGEPMKELRAEEFYEVRYYSPFVTDTDISDSVILNSIKIVPILAESSGDRIDPIANI